MVRRLAAVCLLVAASPAQPASYTFFGTDCQSAIWQPPPFVNLTLPRIGTTLLIQTHSSSGGIGGNVDTYLLTGISRTNWNGVPLPFDTRLLTAVGRSFCGLAYVSGEIILRVPFRGVAPMLEQVPFPIPNVPALVGARIYQQVLQNVLAPNDNDFFLTRAGEAVLGV